MSDRIRCSSIVDLPLPVGPVTIKCSSDDSGSILNFMLPNTLMLFAKVRSLIRFVGSRYHLGGNVSLGWRPMVPGSSSSPNGKSVKLVSSFTDSLNGKCQGTFAKFKFGAFSGISLARTPADSKVRNASKILLIRLTRLT